MGVIARGREGEEMEEGKGEEEEENGKR